MTLNGNVFKKLIYEFRSINLSNNLEKSKVEAKIFITNLIKEIYFYSLERGTKTFPDWLNLIFNELHDFENVKIGVSKIYELSPYSKQHTINVFKQFFDTTPSNYINQRKIEYGANLLKNTNKDILTICFDCGYDTLENFYKNFKVFKGTSPAKYRRSYNLLYL